MSVVCCANSQCEAAVALGMDTEFQRLLGHSMGAVLVSLLLLMALPVSM